MVRSEPQVDPGIGPDALSAERKPELVFSASHGGRSATADQSRPAAGCAGGHRRRVSGEDPGIHRAKGVSDGASEFPERPFGLSVTTYEP